MGNSGIGVPLPELAAYCREAAAEGAVLLKNEGHMLPIKKDETVSILSVRKFPITAVHFVHDRSLQ
mgnify:CR=1 FL=1